MMTSTAQKSRLRSERLEARVTPEQKQLIEYAAALKGATVTDFLLSSVQDAAKKAIEDLLSPTPANERLKDTVDRYKAMSANFERSSDGSRAED
jgi:hypothetical protein